MWTTALVLVVISWVPLAFFVRSMTSKSTQPRVHLFQDMDNQAKLKAQSTSPVFADGRAMRPRVEGTVARGELRIDGHFYYGYELDEELQPIIDESTDAAGTVIQTLRYYESLPDSLTVDAQFMERGKAKYNTFCYPCHGKGGHGDGPVNHRVENLIRISSDSSNWVTPTNMQLEQYLPGEYADGKLHNVINHGIRNMPAYGHMMTPEDRWAVVAYVRALQISQHATPEMIPADQRATVGLEPIE